VHHQPVGLLQVGTKHSPSSNKLKNALTGPFFCGGGCFCMKVRTPFSPPGKPPTRPPSSLLKSSSSSPSRSSILCCEHDEEVLRYYPSRKRLAKRSQSMLWNHSAGSGMSVSFCSTIEFLRAYVCTIFIDLRLPTCAIRQIYLLRWSNEGSANVPLEEALPSPSLHL
jgi:hypothetical protein